MKNSIGLIALLVMSLPASTQAAPDAELRALARWINEAGSSNVLLRAWRSAVHELGCSSSDSITETPQRCEVHPSAPTQAEWKISSISLKTFVQPAVQVDAAARLSRDLAIQFLPDEGPTVQEVIGMDLKQVHPTPPLPGWPTRACHQSLTFWTKDGRNKMGIGIEFSTADCNGKIRTLYFGENL